jgi:hypothetical protein
MKICGDRNATASSFQQMKWFVRFATQILLPTMKESIPMKNLAFHKLAFLTAAVVLLAFSGVASAQGGYDLLQTGAGAQIDLSSAGLGNVPLQGVPIQGATGNTDTIMHRTQDIPAGGGTTPVNVHALFMKSQNPVTFQGQQVDVYVTVNNSGGTIPTSVLPQPDSLSPSTGSINARSDGTFDSSITVNADVIFVKAGTSVTNSANYVGHQPASAINLSSTNSTYSASASTGYPSSTTYPSGGFYPRPVHNGPHPVVPASCGPTPSPRISPTSPTSATTAKTATGTTTKSATTGSMAVAVACLSSTTAQ